MVVIILVWPMGSYRVAELDSKVLSIGWETGAVCPRRPYKHINFMHDVHLKNTFQ